MEEVAAYFESRFSSEEQIQTIHHFFQLKGHHYISCSKTRRFLGVIREYELQRVRFMMEYHAETYCPEDSTTEELDMEALLKLVLNEELFKEMMKTEFEGDDEIVQNVWGLREGIREFEHRNTVGLNYGKRA